MLIATQHLLAEGEPFVKLIIFAVIAVIWGISQVITAITKPKDKLNPQGEVMLPPAAPTPRSTGSKIRTSRQAPAMPKQQQRQASRQPSRQKGPPPLQPTRREPPPIQLSTVSNVVSSVATPRVGKPIVAAKQTKSTAGPNTQERLRAVLRPASLKKNFILTEILRPPLSLRSEE